MKVVKQQYTRQKVERLLGSLLGSPLDITELKKQAYYLFLYV